MKVAFYLYCRAPLGRVLERILGSLEGYPALLPFQVGLVSRHHRKDLPIGETLRSARASASDICRITTPRGELGLTWLYGSRHDVPRMWGDLDIPRADLATIRKLLGALRVATDLTYAVCDQQVVRRDGSLNSEPHKYEAEGIVSALHDLYWWNYFGPEYSGQLPVTDVVRAAATEVEEVDGGGVVLITRPGPKDRVQPHHVKALVREWPVFRKYDARAGFRTPVRVDYSQVWDLPGPVSTEGPIREIVGPSEEFIAAAMDHARRFHEWLHGQGLGPARSERDFIDILQDHEAIIRDELLVPAIAAYGELLRAKLGGVWRKSWLHRGEPVVTRPGRPWTARRPIVEVLEGLEPVER